MTKSEVKKFFESRSAISKSAFCREVDITPQYMNMILRGERPLTDETVQKLKPVMKKYGYNPHRET